MRGKSMTQARTADPQPGLWDEAMSADATGNAPPKRRTREFVAGYAVAVMCRDEAHQEEVYNALRAQGFTLKVLTL